MRGWVGARLDSDIGKPTFLEALIGSRQHGCQITSTSDRVKVFRLLRGEVLRAFFPTIDENAEGYHFFPGHLRQHRRVNLFTMSGSLSAGFTGMTRVFECLVILSFSLHLCIVFHHIVKYDLSTPCFLYPLSPRGIIFFDNR